MSSTPRAHTLAPLAYALPLLHAAKYPSSTVLGLLLGSLDDDASSIAITDALPLLHNYTSLSAMAEVGLSLAQEEAKTRGLQVVGVYMAHETEVTGLGRIGERVLEGLKKGFGGAVGLTVDNVKLGQGTNPYTLHLGAAGGSTKNAGGSSSLKLEREEDIVKGTLELIRRDRVHRSLVDFDDHLEDPDADWVSNAQVKEAVKRRFGASA